MKKNEAGLWEVHIDGKRYEFEKWGAEEALDVLLDLSAIVGGPVGSALSKIFSSDGKGLNTELDAGMLALVFDQLTKNLKKEIVKPLIKKLCAEKILCNGKKISFNIHYEDDLFHMFKVVKAGLEVQFGNFFVAAQDALGTKPKHKDIA